MRVAARLARAGAARVSYGAGGAVEGCWRAAMRALEARTPADEEETRVF